jgi:hypothetical protein
VLPAALSSLYQTQCDKTHALLLAGKCPWCGQNIVHGQSPIGATGDGSGIKTRKVRRAGRVAAVWFLKLAEPDRPLGHRAIVGVFENIGPANMAAIPVLCNALTYPHVAVRAAAAKALARLEMAANDVLPLLKAALRNEWAPVARDAIERAIRQIEV